MRGKRSFAEIRSISKDEQHALVNCTALAVSPVAERVKDAACLAPGQLHTARPPLLLETRFLKGPIKNIFKIAKGTLQ